LPEDESARPYNPLEKRHLAESVVRRLLAQPCAPLESLAPFDGSGVYALYYSGDFRDYIPLRAANREGCEVPIYVGKAIPRGGRIGGWDFEMNPGRSLFTRLSQHAESIRQATNLRVQDFRERHLVVDSVFIPLAENLLIEKSHPVWNVVVGGFGNKDVGEARRTGARSAWDELHPGRKSSARGECRYPLSEIQLRIREHFIRTSGGPERPEELRVLTGPLLSAGAEEDDGDQM
jgi:hypothetical protein